MALSQDSKNLRVQMRNVLANIATSATLASRPGSELQVQAACAVLQDIAIEDNS